MFDVSRRKSTDYAQPRRSSWAEYRPVRSEMRARSFSGTIYSEAEVDDWKELPLMQKLRGYKHESVRVVPRCHRGLR